MLTGSGPGTFQLLWLPRAPIDSYVQNAHSLWIETYAEVGLVGLLLLAAFFAVALASLRTGLSSASPEQRTRVAAIAGAAAAFLVAASIDWVWQMPVLPAAILLLLGAGLVSGSGPEAPSAARVRGRPIGRVLAVVVAVAALIAIGLPLATTTALRRSQAATHAGELRAALAYARTAAAIEPTAASPQLQIALVRELQRDLPAAVSAATDAVNDESTNWQTWLVLSRLQAESGHPRLALEAFRAARARNPRSPLCQVSPLAFLRRSAARAVVAATVLVALGSACPGAAVAGSPPGPASFATGLVDDENFQFGLGGQRDVWLSRARAVGSTAIRITLRWSTVAPVRRPAGCRAADPSDPNYDWSELDAAVRAATAAGQAILLTVYHAPAWVEAQHRPRYVTPGAWEPDPRQLEAFARAVATRYSGRFPTPTSPV